VVKIPWLLNSAYAKSAVSVGVYNAHFNNVSIIFQWWSSSIGGETAVSTYLLKTLSPQVASLWID
jgi:hypothetical protein